MAPCCLPSSCRPSPSRFWLSGEIGRKSLPSFLELERLALALMTIYICIPAGTCTMLTLGFCVCRRRVGDKNLCSRSNGHQLALSIIVTYFLTNIFMRSKLTFELYLTHKTSISPRSAYTFQLNNRNGHREGRTHMQGYIKTSFWRTFLRKK